MFIKEELDNIHAGENIFVSTTYQVGIAGTVLRKGESIGSDGGVQRYISMRVSEDNYVNIFENQIKDIFVYPGEEEFEYWLGFEEKYSVKCFDDENERFSSSIILGEILYSEEKIWDKLSKEEKTEFVDNLGAGTEDIVEMLDIIAENKNRISDLCDKRVQALQNQADFLKSYRQMTDGMPEYYKLAFDFLYKFVGMDKLLE